MGEDKQYALYGAANACRCRATLKMQTLLVSCAVDIAFSDVSVAGSNAGAFADLRNHTQTI